MPYWVPGPVPLSPSRPRSSGYPFPYPNQQYSCSLPNGYPPPMYPAPHPRPFPGPQGMHPPRPFPGPQGPQGMHPPRPFSGPQGMQPPPFMSPPRHYQRPNGMPYEYMNPGSTSNGPYGSQYGAQRHHNTGMPAINHCAQILMVELMEPNMGLPAAGALIEQLDRHPDYPEPIHYMTLLLMLHQLYGGMVDSVKQITRDILQIEDLECSAAVYRFDKRDTWRVYKSRPGSQDRFYCAPYIEVKLSHFPSRKMTKEVIDAIHERCCVLGKHMRPAYKFKTQTHSWKFEPGTIYESINADYFIAKPIVFEPEYEEPSEEEDHNGEQHDKKIKLLTYPGYEDEGGSSKMKLADRPKRLEDLKQELRSCPNKDQCIKTIKSVLANRFSLEAARIKLGFLVKDVQFGNGKWYLWGSLDDTWGLVVASHEVVPYEEEAARKNAKKAQMADRAARRKLRHFAQTIRIVLPVERRNFAGDDKNVEWLMECVEGIRAQLADISTAHSRAAFCISWVGDSDFADWFPPLVVYKPSGDGGHDLLETTEGCQ
ncbi:hypothetical protein F4802DRAFT_211831 [Xylaria palmicola]|nr:hypothetical protein F4802DRAFT_211831 [Xylaria palmicola]